MADQVIINQKDLFEVNLSLSILRSESKLAIMRATNDAITGIRTTSVNEIYGKVNLKKVDIRAAFTLNKMTKSDLSADVSCQGAPVALIKYGARSVQKGVSLKVLRQHKRSTVRHAFIAKMKSGHTGVFWREPRIKGKGKWKVGKRMKLPPPQAGTKLRKYQLPIHELFGPRVPDVFDDPEIMTPVLADASKRFDNRLEHHTERMFAKARG